MRAPESLQAALDALKARYDTPEALALDPLVIALVVEDPFDQECAAWLAAHLAYGRVAPMLRAIRKALAPLGPHPASWLRGHREAEARRILAEALHDWVWRFHTAADLIEWLLAWKRLDGESANLGLEPHLAGGDLALSRLVQRLRKELPPTRGLRFCLPDPGEGSACKRWRMFLRWMVRPGWPDLGRWTAIPAAGLVIPLDTHVARISRCLHLTDRRTPDGRMAAEITEALRTVAPEDPLRYDFALAHLGILGDCTGRFDPGNCARCPLSSVCHGA